MDHAINNEVFLKGKKNAIDLTPLVSINHIIIIAGGGVLFKQGKEGVNWKNWGELIGEEVTAGCTETRSTGMDRDQ